MHNPLSCRFPDAGRQLAKLPLATLPSPISVGALPTQYKAQLIAIKHDEAIAGPYGGNKVRKLEYLLGRARVRGKSRIATFGSIASHHALATAIFSQAAGFDCTCLLSHQSLRSGLGDALRYYQANDVEVLRLPTTRQARTQLMRDRLQGRDTWVVPLGGTSILGTMGFINAALELASQIQAGELPCPQRVYVAFGTMGTAVGLAIGFALAGLPTETHAVRVTAEEFANEARALRLATRCLHYLQQLDGRIPARLDLKLRCRNSYFGDGYGRSNPATDEAILVARRSLGLDLEATYTGKTMAALLHDAASGCQGLSLFWNTYNNRPLPIDHSVAPDYDRIPAEFSRYLEND